MPDPGTTRQELQQMPPGFLSVLFQEIDEAGIYVTKHGEMFRIPPEALPKGAVRCWPGNPAKRRS